MKEKVQAPELRFDGFTDDWEERKLGEVATLSSSKRIHFGRLNRLVPKSSADVSILNLCFF